MSDQQDAIYIGPEDDQGYPSLQQGVNVTQLQKQGIFKVTIKQFQILKESYTVATETQIYKVQIYLNDNEHKIIHRRFSDFQFLFDVSFNTIQIQEVQKYPGLIIPGFQQKSLFSYFEAKISNFKKSIIDLRMSFLSRFLTKILNIKALKQSKEIYNFLAVDKQFQIFKQSNIANLKKKGFIENFITSAGNIFKTKKVDSKYQKILQQAMIVHKQLQLIHSQLIKYPNSIFAEMQLAQGLKQTNPEVYQNQAVSLMFQAQTKLCLQYGPQMMAIVDQLMYCLWDIKFFISIIQRRYEFKQNGDYKNVAILQKTFENSKEQFLQNIRNQIIESKQELKKQINEYKRKLKSTWKY